MAFYSAYNSHGGIILSPDDIWFQIYLAFSNYINKDPEGFRHLFVDHIASKQLKYDAHELIYEEFCNVMVNQINENTKNNICDKLNCNFTTSSIFEKFISNIVVMDSMKNYFKYKFEFSCGIKEVKFLGTLDNWNKLLDKTKSLLEYADGINKDLWIKYINELIPVLEKFIDTYKGHSNEKFWNSIIFEEFVQGYRFGNPDKLSGWLKKFFFNNDHIHKVENIPNYYTKVPVKIINLNITTNVNIYSGFTEENLMYRPTMSIFIV